MAFDFKKEEKTYYTTKQKPMMIDVPDFSCIAIEGIGNPNQENGLYQQAIQKLYTIAYTLKMSYKTEYQIEGFYEYVVPPLEGFWWQDSVHGVDLNHKNTFHWISFIRVPDFITEKNVLWAIESALKKKKLDCSDVKYRTFHEGLCVQIMHVGPFDTEIESVNMMEQYITEQGYFNDFSDERMHHEIYLSDPRKVTPDKYKTIIRHPIRK